MICNAGCDAEASSGKNADRAEGAAIRAAGEGVLGGRLGGQHHGAAQQDSGCRAADAGFMF